MSRQHAGRQNIMRVWTRGAANCRVSMSARTGDRKTMTHLCHCLVHPKIPHSIQIGLLDVESNMEDLGLKLQNVSQCQRWESIPGLYSSQTSLMRGERTEV